jgi:hypothetical protein
LRSLLIAARNRRAKIGSCQSAATTMMDKNSDRIAEVIQAWLVRKGFPN